MPKHSQDMFYLQKTHSEVSRVGKINSMLATVYIGCSLNDNDSLIVSFYLNSQKSLVSFAPHCFCFAARSPPDRHAKG